MNRPHFTIELADGRRCDANHIAVVRGEDGNYMVSFECSGQIQVVDPQTIKHVAYSPSGATWCPFCDAS